MAMIDHSILKNQKLHHLHHTNQSKTRTPSWNKTETNLYASCKSPWTATARVQRHEIVCCLAIYNLHWFILLGSGFLLCWVQFSIRLLCGSHFAYNTVCYSTAVMLSMSIQERDRNDRWDTLSSVVLLSVKSGVKCNCDQLPESCILFWLVATP